MEMVVSHCVIFETVFSFSVTIKSWLLAWKAYLAFP